MSAFSQLTFIARVAFFTLLIGVAGCTTQLAPSYDKAVVDGLAAANTDALTLMASLSAGSKAETFPSREDKYDTLIGRVEALSIQAGARPIPKNKITDAINRALDKRGAQALPDDEFTPPSAHAINKIAETLTKMRDTDRKQGLKPREVQAFKNQIVIYFDQAITYENFLQR